ncbi:sulfatase-like hydrolase/transferase [Salinirubellus salinus]|uniref:Sulfatase-like hydrolase/transferase n=1 Tax=Salinirubellus salinus TaxID=1364945 RepID=A0A9E7R7L9_9EURY|nr:sulfatase-like hydrolase/transferase [Salinirubellus salinus]UWM56728.1 sulfatase-like hydrolase/transferase [Salinirubellus salinus]
MTERNVALVCLEAVRADAFAVHAERLAALADVTFAECRAASSWAVPSHASMFTGRLPHEHGVHAFAPDFSAVDRSATFLAGLDHRAVGVSANRDVGSSSGLDTWFDTFVDVDPTQRYPWGLDAESFRLDYDGALPRPVGALAAALGHEHPVASLANLGALGLRDRAERSDRPVPADDGMRVIERAVDRELVDGDDGTEPWFLFVDAMDAHAPHRRLGLPEFTDLAVPDGWSYTESDAPAYLQHPDQYAADVDHLRACYDASVRYLDRRVAALAERLVTASDRPTTVVVTAAHGEHLLYPGDEGRLGHVGSLGEGLLRVPLLVVNPPAGYPDRVAAPVSHLALPDLLVGLAGSETPDVTADRTVAEVVGPAPGSEGLDGVPPGEWDRAIRCAVDGTAKFCWDSLGNRRRYEVTGPNDQSDPEVAPPPDWGRDRFREDEESVAAFRERVESGAGPEPPC